MIKGSGSRGGSGSIPLTSGSRSGRPKNTWIRWIRINSFVDQKFLPNRTIYQGQEIETKELKRKSLNTKLQKVCYGRIRSQLEMRTDPKDIITFIFREPIHLQVLLIRFEKLLLNFALGHTMTLSVRHLF
jgi:hypothetical protein